MVDGAAMTEDEGVRVTEDQQRRRRQRNLAIAGILVFLVVVFYVVTIIKLGPGMLSRPL